MPSYDHGCRCGFEWEDFYSIKADPPTVCPECKQEGGVQRFVSGGAGRGIVELSGRELKESIKTGAAAMQRDAATSEKTLANLVGESKYQANTVMRENLAREIRAERPSFRTRK